MALPIIMGVAQAGMGIMGAVGKHNAQMAQAKAQNEAMMKEYKYRLQIRDKKWKDELQVYATKLGQYDLQMKAADRAAARAYGVEEYKQNQRLKAANFSSLKLSQAMAKRGGAAAAAGRSGRSAQRMDREVENAFVANQNMIAANLLSAEETSQMSALNIRDQLQSAQNQAYSNVAIAPSQPMELLEPTQVEGPSSAGLALGIGNSILGGIGKTMGAMAPDPGNFGGGGFGGFSGDWNQMSSFVGNNPYGGGLTGFSSPTPLTSGMNFFQ